MSPSQAPVQARSAGWRAAPATLVQTIGEALRLWRAEPRALLTPLLLFALPVLLVQLAMHANLPAWARQPSDGWASADKGDLLRLALGSVAALLLCQGLAVAWEASAALAVSRLRNPQPTGSAQPRPALAKRYGTCLLTDALMVGGLWLQWAVVIAIALALTAGLMQRNAPLAIGLLVLGGLLLVALGWRWAARYGLALSLAAQQPITAREAMRQALHTSAGQRLPVALLRVLGSWWVLNPLSTPASGDIGPHTPLGWAWWLGRQACVLAILAISTTALAILALRPPEQRPTP